MNTKSTEKIGELLLQDKPFGYVRKDRGFLNQRDQFLLVINNFGTTYAQSKEEAESKAKSFGLTLKWTQNDTSKHDR